MKSSLKIFEMFETLLFFFFFKKTFYSWRNIFDDFQEFNSWQSLEMIMWLIVRCFSVNLFFYKNNQAGKKLQGWEIDQINETWHKWSIDETECTSLEETLQ